MHKKELERKDASNRMENRKLQENKPVKTVKDLSKHEFNLLPKLMHHSMANFTLFCFLQKWIMYREASGLKPLKKQHWDEIFAWINMRAGFFLKLGTNRVRMEETEFTTWSFPPERFYS